MSDAVLPIAEHRNGQKWWRRWILQPILDQLKQGITPDKLALTIALGCALGVFPVLGSTTLLCAAVGLLCRLNQPVLQLVNYVLYPVHVAFIVVFVRFGEHLYGAPRVPFSVRQMVGKFRAAPAHFFSEFWMTIVHAVSAWLLVAPLVAGLIYFSLRPALRAAARKSA